MKLYLPILLCASLTLGCTLQLGTDEDYSSLNCETFEESSAVFANPERGYYSHKDFKSANAAKLTTDVIAADRLQNKTLYYTGYYLTDFMSSDISASFLKMMEANFQALRKGGAKCMLRFAYQSDQGDKPWDATPKWVHRHLEQVTPIIQEYSDVIFCFQAGFVGVWGEWYYTDNFVFDPQTKEQHALRKELIDAMLKALPAERQVALRTPMFKRYMYCNNYTDTLTLATAHNGSPKARLCAFNDCFGASADDYGTFTEEGAREMWKKDTRYTIMGGETCNVSQYSVCRQSLKDMEDYHWTYLNSGYNASVLNQWKNGGCFEETERRLGYRLSLSEVYTTPNAVAGGEYRVVVKVKNTGFAAPMNPRGVEIILVDGNGKKSVFKVKDADPRFWFDGLVSTVDKTITIPAEASGKCSLYLNLPDPKTTLHDNPLFSIRLANDGVWESKTGYNKIAEFIL